MPRWATTVAPERSLIACGQSCVIQVMVCEQQLLDVREDAAVLRETLLEGCERLVVGRTGVDERERVALQQPEIDRAEVGHGDRDLGDVAHGRD